MLKWTVKKRLADQPQLTTDGEVIGRFHNRRSLGDILAEEQTKIRTVKSPKYHRRRSLGSHLNSERIKIDKENHFVTPVRRRSIRQSSTPLSDCSNLQQDRIYKRKHHLITSAAASSPPISPISLSEILVEPSAAIFPTSYAPTLPTFDVEYSPVLKTSQRFMSKSTLNFDEVPAKRLKVDLMDISYEFKPEKASTSSPLSTPLVTRKFNENNKIALELSNASKTSMNSSEVGDTTLQQMIDDILASARNGKKFKKCMARPNRDKNANFMKTLSEVCENMEQKSIEKLLSPEKIAEAADKTIIITEERVENEREVISPVAPKKSEITEMHTEETCTLKRQNAVRRKNTSNENKNKKKTEESQKSEQDFHDSSTQKCLSFSSANFDDLSDKFKRSSVASNSSSSSNSYVSQSKFMKNCLMKGSLEVAISTDENRKKIVIHVMKCKNLLKTKDIPQINAYVKCALVGLNLSSGQQNVYQRTAVHKNSCNPAFDHKFSFDINEPEDLSKYLQLAVWHRNRSLKRSEFIGCLTVLVQHVLEGNIEGAFMLQPQSCLVKPTPLIIEADEKLSNIEETFMQIQDGNDEILKYLELGNVINSQGRTPFTQTKLITKQPEDSFGFEISWTNPPKISSVKNLMISSDLLEGDLIIFVGDTNIVSMPKDDIINLIEKQEDSLTLEIFRPIERLNSREIIDRLALQNTPVVNRNASSHSLNRSKRKATDLTETPKSHKSCNFKHPKICFQPTIGNGVIV